MRLRSEGVLFVDLACAKRLKFHLDAMPSSHIATSLAHIMNFALQGPPMPSNRSALERPSAGILSRAGLLIA